MRRMFLVKTGNKGEHRDRIAQCLLGLIASDSTHYLTACDPYTFIEGLKISKEDAEALRKDFESQGIRVMTIATKSTHGEVIEYFWKPDPAKEDSVRNGIEIYQRCVEKLHRRSRAENPHADEEPNG